MPYPDNEEVQYIYVLGVCKNKMTLLLVERCFEETKCNCWHLAAGVFTTSTTVLQKETVWIEF